MIGPKKLGSIRQEVKRALAATGDDPIRWLEQRMIAPGHQGAPARGASEVLQSLRRVLEAPGRKKPRKRRVSTKK